MAAAFFGALFLIPYQAGVARADRGSFLAAMLLSAALFNTVVALVTERRHLLRVDRVAGRTAGILAVATIVGNTAIGLALPILGAGMTSTVMRSQVLITPVLAWIVIREAVGRHLVVGIAIGAAGFVVLRTGHDDLAGAAAFSWWALVAAAAFSAMQVATRHVIRRIRPVQVNALRLWMSVAVMLLLPRDLGGGELRLDGETWLLAAAAGAVGPGVSRLMLMNALRYVSASFTALAGLFAPVFAFVFGYLAFGDVPGRHELLGAALILAGVAWPVIAGYRASDRR